MSARSYISQLQGFLFCPHVEFAFWPSEAMFHSPTHSHQGPFSFWIFSILSLSLLLQKCQTSGQQLKFESVNDFIGIVSPSSPQMKIVFSGHLFGLLPSYISCLYDHEMIGDYQYHRLAA